MTGTPFAFRSRSQVDQPRDRRGRFDVIERGEADGIDLFEQQAPAEDPFSNPFDEPPFDEAGEVPFREGDWADWADGADTALLTPIAEDSDFEFDSYQPSLPGDPAEAPPSDSSRSLEPSLPPPPSRPSGPMFPARRTPRQIATEAARQLAWTTWGELVAESGGILNQGLACLDSTVPGSPLNSALGRNWGRYAMLRNRAELLRQMEQADDIRRQLEETEREIEEASHDIAELNAIAAAADIDRGIEPVDPATFAIAPPEMTVEQELERAEALAALNGNTRAVNLSTQALTYGDRVFLTTGDGVPQIGVVAAAPRIDADEVVMQVLLPDGSSGEWRLPRSGSVQVSGLWDWFADPDSDPDTESGSAPAGAPAA